MDLKTKLCSSLVFVIAALLLVPAGVFAAEKVEDTVNAVSAARATITGELDAASLTWNRTFNNVDPPDPNCTRPSSDSGTDGQFYALHCIQVSSADPIEVVVNAAGTTIGDTVMYLFCQPFDPFNPAANQVFSDDDDGDGLLSAFTLADNIVLTPGNYDLVLSTFSAGAVGTYQIDTSSNVSECGPISVEGSTWGTVKALYK